MASFFTKALDVITPWNRGGETQRRQQAQKKKRQDEQNAPAPTPLGAPRVNQNAGANKPNIQTQRPENLFAGLNNNLKLPGAPNITPPVQKSVDTAPVKPPTPGTVVKPSITVAKPAPAAQILVGGKPVQETPEDKINRGLDRGDSWEKIAKDNNFRVEGVKQFSQATRPDYGINIKKPKQSLGNKFRDIFDTNTEADKYRRQEGNKKAVAAGKPNEVKPLTIERSGNLISRTPVVGNVTKMLNTAATQIASMPATVGNFFATREYGAATDEYTKAVKSGDKNRIAAAKERIGNAINRVDSYNRQQDAAHSMFQKNEGGLFNAGTLYDQEASQRGDVKTGLTDVVLPTAVTALDLYTLGRGAAIEQALKDSGVRTGVRVAAPDIAKASAGNFGSGSLDTLANDGSASDAIKAGLINAGLGLVPDVGLPAITRTFNQRVIPRIVSGQSVNPADVVNEIDDAAISASAEAANQALKPKAIPVREVQDIPVRAPEDIGTPIPVRPTPHYGRPLIKELSGDFNFPDFQKLQQVRIEKQAASAADFNKTGLPDRSVDGVFPRQAGDTSFATKAEIDNERIALDEALANKEINKTQHKAANKELDALQAVDEAPKGKKIEVKQSDTIPVRDETVVPTDLPDTPGQVRVTTQNSPMQAKSEAAANAPVAASAPTRLPAEVQAVLDNPKQFNRRQVEAARNQRKMARQVAKANEQTAEAIDRIDATKSPNEPQAEGFAPTGEFARGKRGNAYQKASQGAEAQAGRAEMQGRSVDNLIEEIGNKESFTPGDRRRLSAAIENMAKSNPDDIETRMILKKLQSKSRTELGQALAMIPRVIRKSSTAETLVNRWDSKIARALDNPSKMTERDLAEVTAATEKFTLARDTAEQLNEQFKRTGSEADFKAWEDAFKAARRADEDAKFTEVSVAKRVLKGEKGSHVNKVIDDLKKESNVNTMDLVTANMLSGTATGFRNTVGTELAGVENRLFANTRAKLTNALFDENVGGFSRKGARMGRKIGLVNFGTDAMRRAKIGGKNPLEWAKNWSTTINSGGESSLQSQVYSRLGKYYERNLKAEGLSGKELDMRMRHSLLTDPDEMSQVYLDSAMKSSGLTGLFDKGQTIEKAVTDYIGRQTDSKMLQGASKLLMRLSVGFPTATGNFLYQSSKRLTAGLPSYLEMGAKLAKGDKLGAAQAFDRGLKETGSGLAILGLGAALGSQDLITGAYPDDPDERARWEREGISENSIKIGGAWYPIPQGAGMFGLPLLTGAAIGRSGSEGVKDMYTPKHLAKLLPTDQIQGFLNMASGNGAPQDFKNFVASTVRASTPLGALLNQIAKSTDSSKNDTTTKSLGANIIDQIASGIPGVNNAMDIPDKTDDAGNVIKNPKPWQIALGATSATQGAGEERSAEIDKKISDQVDSLDKYGLLDDKNMDGVLEEKGLEAYNKLKTGKKIDESDIKAIKEGLVKGVSSEGTDTAYLERGEYDTNLAVLKLKRDLMKEDKTTKPSSIKDIDTAIKRGEIYKEGKVPYDMIDAYQHTSVEEWRKMGDPEDDSYDPDMYQKLWAIDERMTKAGVSYKKGALDKQKYYAKQTKGRGGRARGDGTDASSLSTDFGKLKDSNFAPSVQQYETIDQKSGSVPVIRAVRPNIVHKIGSSG